MADSTDPVLLELPQEIVTERLLLRPPRPGDGALLLEALTESLPQLRRYLASLPWVAGEQTLDSSEIFCRNAHANFLSRRDLPYFVFDKASGRLLGSSGLHRTVWATPKTEVGYWLRTSCQGQGFMTEAVNALVACAFEHMAAVRVELIVDADNAASRRVAERAGFTLEGTHRFERRAPDGSLRDTCVYARLSPSRPAA